TASAAAKTSQVGASKIESLFIATSCHRANETVPIWLHAQAELGALGKRGTKRESEEQNAGSSVGPHQWRKS
ncbi:hypothetical protein, partial [Mesorhizobium sp.]|uniref:hypothetical protein n=1 Tax=Mesorhizobium sp. TaxID=1871066 RepID=UPI0025804D3C